MGTFPNDNGGKRFPAQVLSRDEVGRLLAACSIRGLTGQRNRAMIALLYRAGLRCQEMLDLRPGDIDLERGSVEVLHGKGDRRRVVGIDPGAVAILAQWLATRERLATCRGWRPSLHPVICRLDGEPLCTSTVRQTLRRLRDRAGVAKRVHPHGLRHTMAAELAGEGVDLRVISAQLGHASIATTDRYVRHLMPQDVLRAISERTWGPS